MNIHVNSVSQLLAACALVATISADFVGHSHRSSHNQVRIVIRGMITC